MERARSHPLLWCILMMPFGISSGFVSIALAAQGKAAGLSVGDIASLVALTLLPHTWKFLWAPVTDITLTKRRWYLASNLVASLGIASFALLPIGPGTLGILQLVVFLQSLSTTTLGMAVEALMAHTVPRDEIGRASGWFQAGNLGGGGLGGGLGLMLVGAIGATGATLTVATLSLACTIAVFMVHDVPAVAADRGPLHATVAALKDLWQVVKTRAGTAALVICFVPVGSGAAQSLFVAISKDWAVSDNVVAVSNGALTGGVAAVGCFVGGWISDKLGRKRGYAAAGALLAAVAIGMAIAPRTPEMYVGFCMLYALVVGMCYGTFTGLVLDTIGAGAAATKYNAFASLSNIPIMYMTVVNGAAHSAWGATGLLLVDAAAGLIGLAVFGAFLLMVAVVVRRRLARTGAPPRAVVVPPAA